MKNLSRRDKNGVRTPADLERRYSFNDIDYTKEELEKLKMEIITDDHLSNVSTNPVQNKVVTQALNSKVTKEAGKNLSTNDFTDEEKEKLDGISANAERNIIERVLVNGEEQQVLNKSVYILIDGHTHANKGILDTYTLTEEELLERIKEYSYHIVTTENTTTIPITYEQYTEGNIVEVYINGLKKIKDLHYSIEGNNIILVDEITNLGTEIEVVIKI